MNPKSKQSMVVILYVCVLGFLGSGCASTKNLSKAWEAGDIKGSVAEASRKAENKTLGSAKDVVVWRLNEGAARRAAGEYEQSNKALDLAEEEIDKFEEKAKVKVSQEAIGIISNLEMLDYEGHAYDKIMMNTYKAVNYLQAGDFEKAGHEFKRALERQRDAVEINARRIEMAEEEAQKQKEKAEKDKKGQADLEQINKDEKFQSGLNSNYAELDTYKAYANYENPFTVYLDGLFFLCQGTGGSDWERSRKSFERTLGMVGDNKFIQQDMATIEHLLAGQPQPPTTYVIFETGEAPDRTQIRIDLPLFVVGRPVGQKVPYMGAAFPKLRFHNDQIPQLSVSAGDVTESTALVASMDSIVAQDFKNELPMVVTRTLVGSAGKAAITYGLGEAGGDAGKYLKIIGVLYNAIMNQADKRAWVTLPKEFQVCRLPTPADRKIKLAAPNSAQETEVTVDEGTINVVWVKSINQNTPLIVSQFKLK